MIAHAHPNPGSQDPLPRRCPRCESRMVREPLPGAATGDKISVPAGADQVRVWCPFCDHVAGTWAKLPDGTWLRVPDMARREIGDAIDTLGVCCKSSSGDRCRVAGCRWKAIDELTGLCTRHLSAWNRANFTGKDFDRWLARQHKASTSGPRKSDPGNPGRGGSRFCVCDGCERRVFGYGLCEAHYHRWVKNGRGSVDAFCASPLGGPVGRKNLPKYRPGPCRVDGCERRRYAHGLCRRCYSRWHGQGKPDVSRWVEGQEVAA